MTRGPLFIVGSPRSGTSILARAMSVAGYTGFAEGNFLSLLRVIERDVDRHFAIFDTQDPRVLMSRMDRESLKTALYRVLSQAVDAQQSSATWFDKSGNPDMIEAIPILRTLWPSSHFIFAKRRGIENVLSRVKKFPAHTFDYHCSDWARNMAAWRKVRAAHPDLMGIEIDQQDIGNHPSKVADALGTFLDLQAPALQAIISTFETERPQQTAEGSAHRIIPLDATGWTDTQIASFHRMCDEEMAFYDYSTDASYKLNPALKGR